MDWRIIPGIGRSAFAHFSPGELAAATGLSADLQRVWRRRGHLPARSQSRAVFDSIDAAEISVRYELSKMGVAPTETARLGEDIARLVLYYGLLSNDTAASVHGGLKRLGQIAGQFEADDEIARRISGTDSRWRYIWSPAPPALDLVDDFGAILSAERYAAMLVLDLAVIGSNLAVNSPKPLFVVDVSE
jgi:hypothetical protein